MTHYPFSHTRQALGALAAGFSGPTESAPVWEPRIQATRHPEDIGAWVDVGAALFGKPRDSAREGLGLDPYGDSTARILAWASTSDRDGSPVTLTRRDRETIRALAVILRKAGLTPDNREVALRYKRKLWFELPGNERHVSTTIDD